MPGPPSAVVGATPTPPQTRVVALDQLRGLAMAAMLFVNLNFGYAILPPFFTHGVVYTSGPDLVMPLFHFCVGFALRLTVKRRVAAKGWWATARELASVRVPGLIMLSLFVTEGWGSFPNWRDVSGFGDWLGTLVRNPAPYHTLTHIAFVTVYTFPSMCGPPWVRVAHLLATSALLAALHATFYFRWISSYFLDEGGYFGFVGWAIPALAGSLLYDALVAVSASGAPPSVGAASGGGMTPGVTTPLRVDGAGVVPPPRRHRCSSLYTRCGCRTSTAWLAVDVAVAAVVLGVAAYLLSCLGRLAPLTVCYNTEVNFYGGYGRQVPCPTVDGGAPRWVPAPFVRPPMPDGVVTMWTMTQRAGTVPYHWFTTATSLAAFAAVYAAVDIGFRRPSWWPDRVAALVAGLHTTPGGDTVRLHWHVLEVFGENSLAVYLISSATSDAFSAMVPPNAPVWYFLLWGEGLMFVIVYIFARYLRTHKLFLRL